MAAVFGDWVREKVSLVGSALGSIFCLHKSVTPVGDTVEVPAPDSDMERLVPSFGANAGSNQATVIDSFLDRTVVTYDLTVDQSHFKERYLGRNEMKVVHPVPKDFLGIIFIQTKPEGEDNYIWHATGFLISSPDGNQYVGTAGHVLNYPGPELQYSVRVTAGYGTSYEQIRYGTRAAVHGNWYATGNDVNDFAMFALNEPFTITDLKPFEYCQTPITTSPSGISANIVGFPGDTGTFTFGGLLHKSDGNMTYSGLHAQQVHHDAHTEKGSSGGPIRDDNGVVMAVHTGCHKDGKNNVGIAIDRHGNDLMAFFAALEYSDMSVAENNGVSLTVQDIGIFGHNRLVPGGMAFFWDN